MTLKHVSKCNALARVAELGHVYYIHPGMEGPLLRGVAELQTRLGRVVCEGAADSFLGKIDMRPIFSVRDTTRVACILAIERQLP